MEIDQAVVRAHEDRDPQKNNAFVKVAYSDVICESSAVQSPRWYHRITKLIFDYTVLGTYLFLTILLGGLLSFAYGLTYGVLSFMMVWVATPATRAVFISLGFAGRIWLFIVKCFYDPLYESCGLILSRVNVKINHATIHNV